MPQLKKVRFVRDTLPRECDEPIPAGTEMQMPAASAGRWLRRGAVEIISDPPAAKTRSTTAKNVKANG